MFEAFTWGPVSNTIYYTRFSIIHSTQTTSVVYIVLSDECSSVSRMREPIGRPIGCLKSGRPNDWGNAGMPPGRTKEGTKTSAPHLGISVGIEIEHAENGEVFGGLDGTFPRPLDNHLSEVLDAAVRLVLERRRQVHR